MVPISCDCRLSLCSRLYAALYRLHLANNTTVSYQASVGKYLHFLVRSPMHALTHLGPSLALSHPLILGCRRLTMGRMILPQQPSCGLTRPSLATSTTITTTSSTSGTGICADLPHGPAGGIIRAPKFSCIDSGHPTQSDTGTLSAL